MTVPEDRKTKIDKVKVGVTCVAPFLILKTGESEVSPNDRKTEDFCR